jgi:hypothetical protein
MPRIYESGDAPRDPILTRNTRLNANSRPVDIDPLYWLIRLVFPSLISALLSEVLVYVVNGPLYALEINQKWVNVRDYRTAVSRLSRCFGLLSRLPDIALSISALESEDVLCAKQ